MRKIKFGCTITDIRRGKGERASFVYAKLRDPNGVVLISSTLDYICSEVGFSEIDGVRDPDGAPE